MTSRPVGVSMKGRIASRAHSFKENILEALGHHGHLGSLGSAANGHGAEKAKLGNGSAGQSSKAAIQLAKKTNSTDNLIGYSEPKQSTDGLVRDVQLALRYFEDAVNKGTYEILPGCASIVLERIVGIQAYVFYESQKKNDESLVGAMHNLYAAISALTQWADNVIVTGSLDPAENFTDHVIEPVRKAVIVLVNKLNGVDYATNTSSLNHVVSKNNLHNSLPDITSPDNDTSIYPPVPPPLIPRRSQPPHEEYAQSSHKSSRRRRRRESDQLEAGLATTPPPPLPPKHTKPSSSSSSSSNNYPMGNSDWFSNPLFEASNGGYPPPLPPMARPSTLGYDPNSIDLPSPHGLDTTLPDGHCFPYIDEVSSPLNLSRDSCFGEEITTDDSLALKTLPSRSSFGSNDTSLREGPFAPPPPILPKKEQRRKRSQYDNVWEPQNCGGGGGGGHHGRLSTSYSFDASGRGGRGSSGSRVHEAPVIDPRRAAHMSHAHGHMLRDPEPPIPFLLSRNDRRSSDGMSGVPPPLPPKKRDILNYMELLGQSLIPSREDLMQSLAQTQLLLQNVWAENYHDFGEFVPDNLAFNFPTTQDLFTRNMDLSRLPAPAANNTNMPMKFPDVIDDHLLPPPALPPKKNRSSSQYGHSSSSSNSGHHHRHHPSNSSKKERIIPIVRESDGSVVSPSPVPSSSSSSHSHAHTHSHAHQQQQQQPAHHGPVHRQYSHKSHNSQNHSQSSRSRAPQSSSATKRLSSESAASSSGNSLQSIESAVMNNGGGSITSGSSDRERMEMADASSKNTSQTSSLEHKKSTKKKSRTTKAQNEDTMSESGEASNGTRRQLTHNNSDEDGTQVADDSPLNVLKMKHGESLTYSRAQEEGAMEELRAGGVDHLIILATESTNRDFVYQDAFLLTYRTFISTYSLLWKLEYRFRRFNNDKDPVQLRSARSAFSLLVRVVDSLIDCDFQDSEVVKNLSDFMGELVADGELLLARALRTKFIQKYEERRARQLPDLDFGKLSMSHKPSSLLQFKSADLAEQITLLDAQHFWKLEPGELLLWVKEQNEEKSPNLVKFTKHFNAMSFWCRTRILQETDPKERERLIMKFIKVMKFLRKQNNFNSYLAFLSALDSASIRRLEWSRQIVDTITEYSGIIDCTGSFKAYREALSHSRPPVIPYVGLVLQDLTFVNIGNSDCIQSQQGPQVNFAKRWQQYNILDNIRRFKRESYPFQRKEDIIQYFGNFEDALSDNELWALSERIKPNQRSSPTKFDSLLTTDERNQMNKTYHT